MINQDKPLSAWTLGEAMEECDRHEETCAGCRFYRKKKGCRLYNEHGAAYWDLEKEPRFTQEEVAVLRYFSKHLHIAHLARRKDGGLFGGERPLQPDENGFTSDGPIIGIPRTLFPSLRPGQSVRLEDILEGGA